MMEKYGMDMKKAFLTPLRNSYFRLLVVLRLLISLSKNFIGTAALIFEPKVNLRS